MTRDQFEPEKDSHGQGRLKGEPLDPEACATGQNHFWQYCVNCGTVLESRKCKLICPKCGFYHSCSEP
ncbi:MAG: hypothetical protein A2X66_01745 [Ignavibacteria bacterium GWA2_54_16]|nr:MAG: hypothetical protein A2X66_01745 [Ignavibacteria bacterium GWA2_54_16]